MGSIIVHTEGILQIIKKKTFMNGCFYEEILQPMLNNIKYKRNRNAFYIGERYFSYCSLGQCISGIRIEVAKIATKTAMVGLVINDDLETYASIIALWLEGKCYVPLHPNWPLERCRDICEQVELNLILDSSKETRYEGWDVINTSRLIYEFDCLEPVRDISDDELAYILFTTGSTGKPKGVMMTRRNVAAFMDSFWKTGIQITEKDRCGIVSGMSMSQL